MTLWRRIIVTHDFVATNDVHLLSIIWSIKTMIIEEEPFFQRSHPCKRVLKALIYESITCFTTATCENIKCRMLHHYRVWQCLKLSVHRVWHCLKGDKKENFKKFLEENPWRWCVLWMVWISHILLIWEYPNLSY
jgi:hypothetical protein